MREVIAVAETELIADLPARFRVEVRIEELAATCRRNLQPGEHWVYRRYEPPATEG